MKNFAIVYGEAKKPVQKRAIEELTKILLDYTLEYPICIQEGEDDDLSNYLPIYIGTKENNAYIKEVSRTSLCSAEEYFIKVIDGSVIIEGFDDAGVLYGVLDFYNKYITKFEHPDDDRYWINILTEDSLPDFEYGSAPATKNRGLWTWGHVVYDYCDYLRNMMKLKMNSVIIWNDFVPLNAKEIVEYAHSCNIKVIWGFAWLWDTKCNKVEISNLAGEGEKIFRKFEREYADIGGDGIYFQTFTEVEDDNIGGINIAEAATDFVNSTAALFFEKYPDIELQFGLHATSVKNHLEFLKKVDSRIHIIWEDCGAFPFSYIPTDIKDFNKTVDLALKTATLRGEHDRFGVVTKGLVKLEWREFKHLTGSQWAGVSTENTKKNRIERKRRIWRYIQAGWLANADKAQIAVKEMARVKKGNLSVFALVEDGMFEENIMYPVALYSEMLWNPECEIKDLMKEVALRNYITFA